MNILEPIKINKNSIVLIACIFLAIVSPGYLFLYLYQPNTFFNAGWINLLMLSIAITLPIFSINILLNSAIAEAKDKKNQNIAKADLTNYLFNASIYAAVSSVIVFYISFVFDIYKEVFIAKHFILTVASVQASLIITTLIRILMISVKK
ncbi:MAG TPA: hypothetical protein PKZ75_03255 [Bacteroidia bacterium]|nr:hypothetical protein [Bacteroidia bacterium]